MYSPIISNTSSGTKLKWWIRNQRPLRVCRDKKKLRGNSMHCRSVCCSVCKNVVFYALMFCFCMKNSNNVSLFPLARGLQWGIIYSCPASFYSGWRKSTDWELHLNPIQFTGKPSFLVDISTSASERWEKREGLSESHAKTNTYYKSFFISVFDCKIHRPAWGLADMLIIYDDIIVANI